MYVGTGQASDVLNEAYEGKCDHIYYHWKHVREVMTEHFCKHQYIHCTREIEISFFWEVL